jgi:hypothetical protein
MWGLLHESSRYGDRCSAHRTTLPGAAAFRGAVLGCGFALLPKAGIHPDGECVLTHFDDLTECDYFGKEHVTSLRAIGWLISDRAFSTGPTDSKAFDKLKELLTDPWQPMVLCGVHECELCQYDRPVGHINLFAPSGSVIFVCPELIVHYIAAHRYRPPAEFIVAASACPNTRTMQYKKMLLESGGRSLVTRMR